MEIWRTKIHCPFLKAEVCAYANNQHELGSDLHSNPRETSFFRAWVCLKMGDGPQKMAVNSYGKWPVHCERKFWGAQFSGKSIFRTQYHEDQWSNFGRSVRSCPKFLSDECCGRGDCCTFSLIVSEIPGTISDKESLSSIKIYQLHTCSITCSIINSFSLISEASWKLETKFSLRGIDFRKTYR